MTEKTKAKEQTKFELDKKDFLKTGGVKPKTQEEYLKRLREFFKKFNENKKENKRLPTLPPSFLRKSIPLPSHLKKKMDEYKKMMRGNKGRYFKKLSDAERAEGMTNQKTYAKGGGVRKVRY